MPPPLPALMPSVLDRLMNPAALGPRGADLTHVIESVRRDVEDLLNTRRIVDSILDTYPELSKSVYAYGVPELVSRPADSGPQRAALGRLLAEAIARHEPRLSRVSATLMSDADSTDRALRFLVAATLRLEPAPGVEFETVVRLSTGQTTVKARTT